MKYLVPLLLLLFTIACDDVPRTESGEVINDWKKLNLNSNVKAIKEIKFLAVDNFSEIKNGEKIRHIYNKEMLFNLDGYLIEENDYIPDGTLANRTMFLYKNDKLIEYNEYDSQGMLFGTGKYELDEKGLPKTLVYKTNDGRYNWSKTFTHDSNGNVTEVDLLNSTGVLESKEIYTYNNQDLLVESELHKNQKLFSKNTYKSDEGGSIVEMNYSGDSSTFTYIYNYDSKGNWIKKIVFENNVPSGILVREIEYFN